MSQLQGSKGSILTFYSYKGGVGRTFVLANVAAALTRWGYRILCIDWDLEAPGLASYFGPFVEAPTGGVVELVSAFSVTESLPWQDFISRVSIPEIGELDIILAGGDEAEYIELEQGLNWHQLYERTSFPQKLEDLREEWRDAYDLVLVDSRTGLSDISGICTVQLPDILVAVFSTNRQSMDGAVKVAERSREKTLALPFDRASVAVVPLLSRFDPILEHPVAGEWFDRTSQASELLASGWIHRDVEITSLLPHLRIPYYPRWSFGEELALREENSRDPLSVSYAVETLAALFAHQLARTDVLVESRDDYVEAATSRSSPKSQRRFSRDVQIEASQKDLPAAQMLVQALSARGVSVGWELDATESEEEDSLVTFRHLLVLVGRGQTTWLEEKSRRFIRLTLVDETPRRLLPILIDRTARVPPVLASFRAVDATGRTWSDVADEVLTVLKTGETPDEGLSSDTSEVWEEPGDAFIEGVVQQLRAGDDIPLRRTLPRMVSATRALMDQPGAEPRLEVLLDRLACLLATFLMLERESLLDRALATLVGVYDAGFDERGMPRQSPVPPARLWVDVVVRVMAMGGYATRSADWSTVRKLTLQKPHGKDFEGGYYATWIRHGITMAYRANLIPQPNRQGETVIADARIKVDDEPCLRPDVPAGDDRILSSICQFDALAALVTLTDSYGDSDSGPRTRAVDLYFPSFSVYSQTRVESIIAELIRDGSMRRELAPVSDALLAEAISSLSEAARIAAREFGFFWNGFEDPIVNQFVESNHESM